MNKHVRGIIFLGTPFRGSGTGDAAALLIRLIKTMGGESSDSLIKYVQDPRFNLHEMGKRFVSTAKQREIPLACFYETKPTIVLNRLLPNRLVSFIPPWLRGWIPFAKGTIVRSGLCDILILR